MGFTTRYRLYEYLAMSFGLTNALAHFMYLMLYSGQSWTRLSWFSLMIYLYIQRVRKNMKSICESFCNDCEIISSMKSLVNVNYGLVNVILGLCDITRRNRCGPRQGERCLGLEATNICNSSVQFSWVGWLLSKVLSELL
jgi:hypothetical protein